MAKKGQEGDGYQMGMGPPLAGSPPTTPFAQRPPINYPLVPNTGGGSITMGQAPAMADGTPSVIQQYQARAAKGDNNQTTPQTLQYQLLFDQILKPLMDQAAQGFQGIASQYGQHASSQGLAGPYANAFNQYNPNFMAGLAAMGPYLESQLGPMSLLNMFNSGQQQQSTLQQQMNADLARQNAIATTAANAQVAGQVAGLPGILGTLPGGTDATGTANGANPTGLPGIKLTS